MQKEIERVENAIDRDPALAIGTAKEPVETCCKSILAKRSAQFSSKTSLPELAKLLARELNLVPEGISDETRRADTICLILRNLGALTQYLAELRGLYGSGHGCDGKQQRLSHVTRGLRSERQLLSLILLLRHIARALAQNKVSATKSLTR